LEYFFGPSCAHNCEKNRRPGQMKSRKRILVFYANERSKRSEAEDLKNLRIDL
jgi:hypothetical protein